VLESTGTGITEWDLDENVVSWDETLRDLTGRNPTCIEEFFEAVHPDDRERVRAAVGAMRETGEALTEEFRILPDDSDGDGDGDGDSRDENENAVWLEMRVVATGEKREDDGGPTEALGTGTDVTERKRRRREARRNKRRFEQFAEAVPNGFFITAADYSELVNVNEAHAELTGVSRERLEEAPLAWLEYVVSEDRHRIEAAMQRKDDGEIEFPFEQQYRIDHPERGQRWLSVTIHLLDPDPDLDSGSDADTEAEAEDGENLAGVVTDITDQKRREERLESLHGATRRLLDVVERDEAFETAATAFDDVLGLNVVGFYKRVGDVLVRTAQTGTGSVSPPERVAHDEPSPLWTALDSGKPVVYDDVSNVDDGVDRGTVESAAYVPVGDHGVVAVGVTDARRLDGNEYRLIEVLTGNLAAVLDRVEREKSLAASEQRYRTLAENVPNGAVLLVDDDLEYVLATGELIEAFGLEESDVVGRPAGSLPVDGDVSIRDHYRGALDGESVDRRVSVGDRVLRVHVVPVERGNADAQVLVLVQDVTEEARRERELAEERERFQLLTESVDEYAFVALDEDGIVATWNDGASDLFGYDTETAVRTPLEAFYPTAKRESGLPDRLIEQARIAGESAYEGQHVRADGSTFHADVRYAFLETDEGESRGYAMIARDMTERRRQRRRTERFVEESDEVVAVSDPQGMFEYVSGSATRVLGYDPEALLGRNLFDFVHEDDREAVMETYFGAVDRPDGRAQTECRVTAATGEWRSVEVRVRNMCDNGAIGGMLVYLRDVTESKARARRFESVFNSTYQFTGLLDTDGTIREANEAILDFVGRDREAIVGTPLHEAPLWGDPDGRDRAREAVDRAARGEFVRYETEITGVDRVATVDVSVKPVTDDGAITALVAEGRDITARRRHRRHMQVLQRVLRHNIRNDVNKLEGWVQVLAEVEDPDERAMHVETVVEILEKWSSMTETVREIQEVLDAERSSEMLVDVATLVEGVVTSGQWPETTVESTVEEDLKATVPTSLRKAVTELVDNAVEASENPTVRIDASSVGTDGGRNWVELSVTDNGPGLPDMEAEVLHEGEETPLSHGTGLGLWMVRMLVEQAGGEISVDVTNTGTIVSLRLPDGRLPSDRA
jgi:PAS domain S-box-containing protein